MIYHFHKGLHSIELWRKMFESNPKTVGDMMTIVNKHADMEDAERAHCRHKIKNDSSERPPQRDNRLLVFCNIMNKIRKRTDTAVAFTQEYFRVSYPLGNVSTLPMGAYPSVFQGIVSTGEREYTTYGFRLIQGHTLVQEG